MFIRILADVANIDIPINPPAEWFSPPEAGIPTDKRITIDGNGRVYGYIALWDTCHVGMEGCVKPPKGSPSGYDYAHQGETLTADGSIVKTAVIGGGAGHAPQNLDTVSVPAYYDNTGTQLMRVRYGEDQNGLWFAGALWPDVNELQVASIRASSISGDWRWHAAWRRSASGYDFAGSCLVNIPGFPMLSSRGSNNAHGRMHALAASMGPYVNIDDDSEYIFYGDKMDIVAGALPFQAKDKADPGSGWDGPAVVAGASGKSQLRMIHAWVDPNGDPEAKSSYKLPHHELDGRVNLRGVHAAMAALMGARGGVDIPESDRRAVYNHLAKHYAQFDQEPPPLRANAMNDPCDGNCDGCNCGGKKSLAEIVDMLKDHIDITASAESSDDEVDEIAELRGIVDSVIEENKALRASIDNLIADKLIDEAAK